jgi:hypothetical protein
MNMRIPEINSKMSKKAAHYLIHSDNAFVICGLKVAFCVKSRGDIEGVKFEQINNSLVSSAIYAAALKKQYGKTVLIDEKGDVQNANFAMEEYKENEAVRVLKEREKSLINLIEGIKVAESYTNFPLSSTEKSRLSKYKSLLEETKEGIKKLEGLL